MNAAMMSMSQRTMWQRAVSLALLVAMLATTVSTALASEPPGVDDSSQRLAPSYAVADCEAQSALASPNRQQVTAPYAGLVSLRNNPFGYDLWHPAGWATADLSSGSEHRIVFVPDVQNQGMGFFIEARDMGTAVTGDDIPELMASFNDLIRVLPNTEVIWQARWWSGNVMGFEAKYTYRDSDTPAKRWVRLLYVGTWQYRLVAEAPSLADFDSVEPMFLAMMVTFRLDGQYHDAPNLCIA